MAMIRKVKKKGRINEKWEQVLGSAPWNFRGLVRATCRGGRNGVDGLARATCKFCHRAHAVPGGLWTVDGVDLVVDLYARLSSW